MVAIAADKRRERGIRTMQELRSKVLRHMLRSLARAFTLEQAEAAGWFAPGLVVLYAIVVRDPATGEVYFYLGQTGKLRQRWTRHKSGLEHSKHHCQRLQQAFNAYGLSSLTLVVLTPLSALWGPHIEEVLLYLLVGTDACLNTSWHAGFDGATRRARGRDPVIEPKRRANSAKSCRAPEFRAKQVWLWHLPDIRQRRIAGMVRAWARRDVREHLSAVRAWQWEQPEFRRRGLEQLQRAGARGHETQSRPEHRAQRSRRVRRPGRVYCLQAPTGERYCDIPNLTAFARDHHLNRRNLAAVCNGRRRSCAGWRRVADGEHAADCPCSNGGHVA